MKMYSAELQRARHYLSDHVATARRSRAFDFRQPETSHYAYSLTWTGGSLALAGDCGELVITHYEALRNLKSGLRWAAGSDYDYLLSKTCRRQTYDPAATAREIIWMLNNRAITAHREYHREVREWRASRSEYSDEQKASWLSNRPEKPTCRPVDPLAYRSAWERDWIVDGYEAPDGCVIVGKGLEWLAFIGRPDEPGWMPWSGVGASPVPLDQLVEYRLRSGETYTDPAGALFWPHTVDGHDIIAFRLAPTAPVEASGSERVVPVCLEIPLSNHMKVTLEYDPDGSRTATLWNEANEPIADGDVPDLAALRPQPSGETREHGPKCWGKTSASDEMAHCYCGSEDSPQLREAVLKGVGKINGDGWKDTTTEGEIVFVWNAEKPTPYAAGQYPRIGNEGWSASTSQYDFTPATANDVPAILAFLARNGKGEG